MEGRGVLAALAGAMALAGLGPADAAAQEGAVVIAWHGDPARCAPAGLCGVSGSVVYVPRAVTTGSFGRPSELPSMVPERVPVARAALQEPGAEPRQCVDALAGDVLRLDSVPGTRLVPVDEGSAGGRCAGPTFADVRDALPRATQGPPGLLDLRGRRPFSAGPLAGEVISSPILRAQRGAATARLARSARAQRRRVVEYAVTYRIRRVSGAFGVDFRAGAPPCAESVPLTDGLLVFEPDGAGLGAGLMAGPNAMLTRCPGLGGADLAPDEFLATAHLAPRALRGSRPTLRLTRQVDLANDGYIGRIDSDVRVTLRRTAIRRATIVDDG